MMPIPDFYAAASELPFNSSAVAGRLILAPETPLDADPVWILLRGGELLVAPSPAGFVLPCGAQPPLPLAADPLVIGQWDGRPCVVAPVSRQQELPAGLLAESLAAPEPQLPIELLTLGGTAQQILHWERNSRHCSACGGATSPIAGGWGKRCGGCGAERFPHIHPCAIVAVTRRDEILLARKAEWPTGRYGLVAGFVDFGEALEETVAREVAEETGIKVKEIRYVGSQAWPFPSQLMAGFTAEYAGGEIEVDRTELEDARWFKLDALPNLPPKRSIARFLIDRLVAEREQSV